MVTAEMLEKIASGELNPTLAEMYENTEYKIRLWPEGRLKSTGEKWVHRKFYDGVELRDAKGDAVIFADLNTRTGEEIKLFDCYGDYWKGDDERTEEFMQVCRACRDKEILADSTFHAAIMAIERRLNGFLTFALPFNEWVGQRPDMDISLFLDNLADYILRAVVNAVTDGTDDDKEMLCREESPLWKSALRTANRILFENKRIKAGLRQKLRKRQRNSKGKNGAMLP